MSFSYIDNTTASTGVEYCSTNNMNEEENMKYLKSVYLKELLKLHETIQPVVSFHVQNVDSEYSYFPTDHTTEEEEMTYLKSMYSIELLELYGILDPADDSSVSSLEQTAN